MIFLLAEGVPAECMVGTFNSNGWVALAVTVLGLLGAVYSLNKGFVWLREQAHSRTTGHPSPDRHAAKSLLLGLWLLLPPAWFYVEDIFFYRHFGKAACFDSFRYAQEIVARGWMVFVATLSILYFGREIFGRE